MPGAIGRNKQLVRDLRRYAWWLGAQSKPIRWFVNRFGWRLSRIVLRWLHRPNGALSWPFGLGLLVLNADDNLAVTYLPWIKPMFHGLVDKHGCLKIDIGHIDIGGIAYAALRMYELTGDKRYFILGKRFAGILLAMPGAEEGTIPYNTSNGYVLVDIVAFICPFLARLTRLTGESIYAALAVRQLDVMWQHGHALAPWIQHGFRRDNLQPVGSVEWGRGLGWLILGLVDTLIELPVSPERNALYTKTTLVLDKLTVEQLNSGHFPLMLGSNDKTPDSSLTAIVAYSIARLRQVGIQADGVYDGLLSRCRAAIEASTQKNGCVLDCSGEAAGWGEYSFKLGNHLWVQGPAVACDAILEQHPVFGRVS